jgi:hypothetical protein
VSARRPCTPASRGRDSAPADNSVNTGSPVVVFQKPVLVMHRGGATTDGAVEGISSLQLRAADQQERRTGDPRAPVEDTSDHLTVKSVRRGERPLDL